LRDHENDPEVVELESISTALRHLDPSNYTEYQREKEVTRRRLSAVGPRVHRAIQESLSVLNAHVDQLEPLLDEQPYRLSYWRVAADELNYRPFFDIYDLAAIRVEDPRVFAEVHRRIVPWARGGLVTGLRVDHIDGLRDPEGYVRSLRDACGDCAVFVEKILMQDEALRPEWDVQGTTGYEFANLVNGLYVNPQNRKAFRELYARFTGSDRDFSDVLYESKQLIVRRFMWAEVHTLARALDRISERHRMTRDFTLNSLQEALAEVIACFPVYRTYIRGTPVSAEDRESIQTAIRAAKRRNPATPTPIFDFVSSVLLVEEADDERMEFVFRFQQLTGPVMAKGLEDTAFYRFYPLASLNEVGGNPEIFGIPIERFHRKNQERAASRPHGLSATSTHDTKRSEDVRARLNVLSEIPAEWERTLLRWREMNAALKTNLGGAPVPDANEEYLLYQTLVGTWEGGGDEYVSRIQAYMNKALKEAKLHTSWINPNEAYDRAVQEFVAAVLHSPFAADLNEFVSSRIARPGMLNSLSQTFLKIASPGTPDFYQGTELWDFSLVDPDNRRPVDYARRRELLAAVRREPNPASLLENDRDGRIKLFVIHRALEFRRQRRELFLQGQYRPLECDSARVCAFARTLGGEAVIAAAGRFFASAEDWGPSALSGVEPGTYRDIFTGRTFEAAQGTLRVADIFSPLPLSLLERSD
jgi:(1->4)-alpha-D-glucan 1-alpha-D-glucosylmutase